MRLYLDIFEATREIERDLFEMGIKSKSTTHQNHDVSKTDDFESKELIGYSYSLPILNVIEQESSKLLEKTLIYLGKQVGQSCNYIAAEVADRIKNVPNPGNSYKVNEELWKQFMVAGKFDYTYAERYHSHDQLNMVIEELINNLESRRAVLSVYYPNLDTDLRADTGRIPCSMYYQFLIREEQGETKLNVIYVMRSCDFYEHWIHDVIMTMKIAKYVATSVGIATKKKIILGNFIHQIGSFHMFKKDYSKRTIY